MGAFLIRGVRGVRGFWGIRGFWGGLRPGSRRRRRGAPSGTRDRLGRAHGHTHHHEPHAGPHGHAHAHAHAHSHGHGDDDACVPTHAVLPFLLGLALHNLVDGLVIGTSHEVSDTAAAGVRAAKNEKHP